MNYLPLVLFFVVLFTPQKLSAQEAQFPIVPHYGGIYNYDGAAPPNAGSNYQIVIDLKSLQQDKNKINPGLNNVARMMNLHVLGGVEPENLEVIVIVHGNATDAVSTHEAYRNRYGVDNPNVALITELEKAGAKIYVCAQSLLGRKYPSEEVNAEVTVGLSMLTVFSTYVGKGFVPFIFD